MIKSLIILLATSLTLHGTTVCSGWIVPAGKTYQIDTISFKTTGQFLVSTMIFDCEGTVIDTSLASDNIHWELSGGCADNMLLDDMYSSTTAITSVVGDTTFLILHYGREQLDTAVVIAEFVPEAGIGYYSPQFDTIYSGTNPTLFSIDKNNVYLEQDSFLLSFYYTPPGGASSAPYPDTILWTIPEPEKIKVTKSATAPWEYIIHAASIIEPSPLIFTTENSVRSDTIWVSLVSSAAISAKPFTIPLTRNSDKNAYDLLGRTIAPEIVKQKQRSRSLQIIVEYHGKCITKIR